MFISCADKKRTKEAAEGSAPRDPLRRPHFKMRTGSDALMNRDTFATKLGRKGCVSILVVAVRFRENCKLSLLIKFYLDLFNCKVGKYGEIHIAV